MLYGFKNLAMEMNWVKMRPKCQLSTIWVSIKAGGCNESHKLYLYGTTGNVVWSRVLTGPHYGLQWYNKFIRPEERF